MGQPIWVHVGYPTWGHVWKTIWGARLNFMCSPYRLYFMGLPTWVTHGTYVGQPIWACPAKTYLGPANSCYLGKRTLKKHLSFPVRMKLNYEYFYYINVIRYITAIKISALSMTDQSFKCFHRLLTPGLIFK